MPGLLSKTDTSRYIRHGKHQGGSDSWRTNPRMFKNLAREFGGFTLDAAASADNALCDRFWSEENDALTQDWSLEGRVFCNPPFSLAAEFLAHAHKPELSVFLIPCRPQTSWWLRYVFGNPHCHEIRFLHRGPKFLHPETGDSSIRAPLPTAVVVYRREPCNADKRITVNCADTLLPLEVVCRGGKPGRPKIYTWETLDSVINLWDNKRQTAKQIAEALSIPLRTVQRIVQRLV
ncbi:DNA N-6-adenine-methyltransferase [Klebsiella michiganensis]